MNKPKRRAAFKPASSVPIKKRKVERLSRGRAVKDVETKKDNVPAVIIDDVNEAIEDITDAVGETFEVENIVDEKFNKELCRQEFLIKWKGWGSAYNSWEPEENLACEKLLSDFKSARQILDSIRIDAESSASEFETQFLSASRESLSQETLLAYAQEHLRLERKLDELRNTMKEQLAFVSLKKRREEQEQTLKEWEKILKSKLTSGMELLVENTVDMAGPPPDFTYIESNMIGNDVPIASLSEHCCGCECTDCSSSTNCCPHLGGAQLAYNKFGKVRPGTGAIYECNRLCKCPPDCQNRMVQHGSKVKLCIFRTKNKGWGVRALQLIKKDTFVVEYVGEVITSEEVDKRGHDTVEGRTYYFDLDFNNSKDPPYSIDASACGNVSHFINHSCEPNLKVFPIWVEWIEPDLPRLALFATRDIKKGEELCFDYSGKLYDIAEEAKKEEHDKSIAENKEEEPAADKIGTEPKAEENGKEEESGSVLNGENEKPLENGEAKNEDEGGEEERQKFRCYCGTKKCRKFVSL